MGSVGRLIVAGLLLALSGQAVVLPVAAHSGGGTDTGTVLTRHLLRTDYVGSDPIGSDPVGADTVGSDPIGQDTRGSGKRVQSEQPKRVAAPATEARTNVTQSPATGPRCSTAAAVVASNPNTTIFAQLIQAGGLQPYLQSPSNAPLMLLAPDDIAWQAFLQGFGLTIEKLLADRDLLQALLPFHVIPGIALPSDQWEPSTKLPMLAPGQTVTVQLPSSSNRYTYLQGAQGYALGGVLAEKPACGGALVFVLGSVLISEAADGVLTRQGLVAAG
ncbi:hypothetical protein D9Q98_005155 [Chlorella vulgaris]|uniref:FAS1 domain-containing protein n=1 Tax=Chlorella vulgaris TaxID=3077 RepID=A0A9D4TNS0_CHLVU|nr:hypothetical protein D9Q98_005155 [Chlorella vulgaris]